jgi:hypothetical protein
MGSCKRHPGSWKHLPFDSTSSQLPVFDFNQEGLKQVYITPERPWPRATLYHSESLMMMLLSADLLRKHSYNTRAPAGMLIHLSQFRLLANDARLRASSF